MFNDARILFKDTTRGKRLMRQSDNIAKSVDNHRENLLKEISEGVDKKIDQYNINTTNPKIINKQYLKDKLVLEGFILKCKLAELVAGIFVESIVLDKSFVKHNQDKLLNNSYSFLKNLLLNNEMSIYNNFENNESELVKDIFNECERQAKKETEEVLIDVDNKKVNGDKVLSKLVDDCNDEEDFEENMHATGPQEPNVTNDSKIEKDTLRKDLKNTTGEIREKSPKTDAHDGEYSEVKDIKRNYLKTNYNKYGIKDIRDNITAKYRKPSGIEEAHKLTITPFNIINKIKNKIVNVMSEEYNTAAKSRIQEERLKAKKDSVFYERYANNRKPISFFKKMYASNLKNPLSESGLYEDVPMTSEKAQDFVLAETIIQYTMLETLNTMRLITITRENREDIARKLNILY